MKNTFEVTGYRYTYLVPALMLGGGVLAFLYAKKTGKGKVLITSAGLVAGLIAGITINKPVKV